MTVANHYAPYYILYEDDDGSDLKTTFAYLLGAIAIAAIIFGVCLTTTNANTYNNSTLYKQTHSYSNIDITDSYYATMSKFLTYNGVNTTVEELKEFGHQAIDGNKVYGLLCKACSTNNDILLRLPNQHLKALPHNTLIQLPNDLLILDHISGDTVFLSGESDTFVIMKSYKDFEKEYRTNNGVAYTIVSRNYDLR